MRRGDSRGDLVVWVELQNLMVAASNLARIFRGRPGLRDRWETDPVRLMSAKVRDRFEHIDAISDERSGTSGRAHVDFHVGRGDPPGHVRRRDVIRHLDLDTMVVTFWGKRFSVPEAVAEARRLIAIHARAEPRGRHF